MCLFYSIFSLLDADNRLALFILQLYDTLKQYHSKFSVRFPDIIVTQFTSFNNTLYRLCSRLGKPYCCHPITARFTSALCACTTELCNSLQSQCPSVSQRPTASGLLPASTHIHWTSLREKNSGTTTSCRCTTTG